jgi:tetratricopeptide (TPR) repeat protein
MHRSINLVSASLSIVLSMGWPVGAQNSPFPQSARQTPAQPLSQVLDTSVQMLKSGRAMETVTYLQRASLDYPPSAAIHFQIGNGYCDAKNYPAAVAEYAEALRIDPKFSAAVLNTAYAYVSAEQYDLSMPWFNRYMRENPKSTNLAEVRSQMLKAQAAKASRAKRFYEAKTLLEQACQINPNSYAMHFKLAGACDELGDTGRAIREYETCLRLKSDFSPAIFNIAGCYQTLGRTNDAVTWFQKYLTVEPNAPDRQTIENMITKLREKGPQLNADPHTPDYLESIMENGKFYRWPINRLPLKVFVDTGAAVPNFKEAYRTGFLEALSAWSTASQNKLTFMLVPSPIGADIAADWTANPYEVRQSGSDVEQGICFMQSLTNKRQHTVDEFIATARLRICTIDRETGKPLGDDDMKKTCLHELGHALGLRGHSSNNHDIMFYSVSPTVWPVLSKRDKATLCRLYEQYPQQTPAAASAAPANFQSP